MARKRGRTVLCNNAPPAEAHFEGDNCVSFWLSSLVDCSDAGVQAPQHGRDLGHDYRQKRGCSGQGFGPPWWTLCVCPLSGVAATRVLAGLQRGAMSQNLPGWLTGLIVQPSGFRFNCWAGRSLHDCRADACADRGHVESIKSDTVEELVKSNSERGGRGTPHGAWQRSFPCCCQARAACHRVPAPVALARVVCSGLNRGSAAAVIHNR